MTRPILTLALMTLFAGCAGGQPTPRLPMNDPAVFAELLHHDLIALVAVEKAQLSVWATDPSNALIRRRQAKVLVRLLESWKATSSTRPDQTLELTVTQAGPARGRVADDYGPWSKCDLESKPQLLLFCQQLEPEATLARTLSDGCRVLVQLPDPGYPFALEDVRLGMSLQRRSNFPAIVQTHEWQEEVFQQRAKLGSLMARFLIESTRLVKADDVGGILHRLIDAPDTAPLCRLILIGYLAEQVALEQTPAVDKRAKLVRSLFKILKEPPISARIIHEDLCQTRLRNLVFDASNKPYFPARDAFVHPAERSDALNQIARHPFSSELRDLFTRWLGAD